LATTIQTRRRRRRMRKKEKEAKKEREKKSRYAPRQRVGAFASLGGVNGVACP